MLKYVCITTLLIMVVATGGLYAQSQETIDATQDLTISQLLNTDAVYENQIMVLSGEIIALRSSLDRFTGIGIGVGACLTMLQFIQVVMIGRNGREKK